MCLSPVKIDLYRSRYFDSDRSFNTSATVPCGSCLQCSTSSHNDLFLRALSEYRDCVSNGGLCLFLTYTYNEDSVPFFHFYLDDDGFIHLDSCSRSDGDSPFTLMAFNKSHFQNYLKNLREFFFDKFGSRSSLRYLCVPEYGSQSTQRPHYHCIFFIDFSLVSKFPSINLESYLLDLFSKFWKFGHVSASDDGLFVNSETCISYVCKYVCKNSDLLSFSRFQNLFDFISSCFYGPSYRDNGLLSCPHGHCFNSPMSYFLYYVKFFECAFYVVKSVGFGLGLMKSLDLSSPEAFVKSCDNGISVDSSHGTVRKLRFPRYIIHKCLYSHRSDGSYFLNDFGIGVQYHLCVSSINSSIEYLKHFDFSVIDDLFKIPSSDLESTFGKSFSHLIPYMHSFHDFSKRLILCSDRIFAYGLLIRNRFISLPCFVRFRPFFNSFFNSSLSLSSFLSSYFREVFECFPLHDALPSDSTCLGDYLFSSSFNDDYFRFFEISEFDILLDFWTFISNFARGTLLRKYDELNRQSKSINDLLNFKKYVF